MPLCSGLVGSHYPGFYGLPDPVHTLSSEPIGGQVGSGDLVALAKV